MARHMADLSNDTGRSWFDEVIDYVRDSDSIIMVELESVASWLIHRFGSWAHSHWFLNPHAHQRFAGLLSSQTRFEGRTSPFSLLFYANRMASYNHALDVESLPNRHSIRVRMRLSHIIRASVRVGLRPNKRNASS
jgi:hypothetical protein